MRADVPAYMPPPSMRFDTTSGGIVSINEYRLPADGMSFSTQPGIVGWVTVGGGTSMGVAGAVSGGD
jgi:hypothetical protein